MTENKTPEQNINQDQNELFRERIGIRQEFGYLIIDPRQRKFLWNFFRTNKRTFVLMLVFLGLQVFLEILFFSTSHNVLSAASRPLYQQYSTIFLIGSVTVILWYALSVYISIYYERKFVLELTNKVRARMFANLMNKETSKAPAQERLSLITEISYHLSLLTLGIDSVVISLLRWLFYFGAAIVYIAVFKPSYLYFLPLILFANVVLYLISYWFSRNFITREAASYSKIIDQVVSAAYNFNFIKKLKLEDKNKQHLAEVVKVDTFFRIRRDIWIRYSNRVVFILLAVFAVLISLLTNFHQIKINLNANLVMQGVLFIYLVRIMYLSIRCGIYTTPLQVGLSLSVPKEKFTLHSRRNKWPWEGITFISNKVRLYKEAAYIKDFRYTFARGKRYLFIAPNSYSGKTELAKLFAGEATYNRHSFLVKVGKERMAYNQWADSFVSKYYFSVYVSAMMRVEEFLFRKRSQDIVSADIDKLNAIISSNKLFANFRLTYELLTSPLENHASNYTTMFHLHLLYVLLHQPNFVVIDNIWLDLNHEEINQGLSLLAEALPDATIITFSRNKNKLIKYDEVLALNASVEETTV